MAKQYNGLVAEAETSAGDAMKITVRTAAAFAFAPMAVPVVFVALAFAFPALQGGPGSPAGVWDRLLGLAWWTLVVSLSSLPVAYAVELVVGLPVWIVFRHYRIRSVGIFALGGATIGWLADLCLSVWSGRRLMEALNPLSSDWLRYDLNFVVSAAAAAILFWVIAFPRDASAR